MALTHSSTLTKSNASETAWDLHTGDAVVALTRDGYRMWMSWAISFPGLEFCGAPANIADTPTIDALEAMWTEHRTDA